MGRWKEEMEVEFVKLSNRIEALESQIAARPDTALKSYKQIQDDWHAQHNSLPDRFIFDKAPTP